MRQPASHYDEREDEFELLGEERADEYAPRDRRLPALLLTVAAMALFAGGLWFAYVQGTRHPAVAVQTQSSDGVPLIRADERPTKVKPDQPGGMKIPDQNVSLYNDKPGAAAVEKLLPQAEQPMPRPAPPPSTKIAPPSPAAPSANPIETAAPPATSQPGVAAPAKPPAKPAAEPKASAQAKPPAAPRITMVAPEPAAGGKIQVRLGSLRSPDAAREEWARLKRANADLLGNLKANAVRTDLGEKGIYYRIEAGPFADAAAAERLCAELKRRNHGCLLAR